MAAKLPPDFRCDDFYSRTIGFEVMTDGENFQKPGIFRWIASTSIPARRLPQALDSFVQSNLGLPPECGESVLVSENHTRRERELLVSKLRKVDIHFPIADLSEDIKNLTHAVSHSGADIDCRESVVSSQREEDCLGYIVEMDVVPNGIC